MKHEDGYRKSAFAQAREEISYEVWREEVDLLKNNIRKNMRNRTRLQVIWDKIFPFVITRRRK